MTSSTVFKFNTKEMVLDNLIIQVTGKTILFGTTNEKGEIKYHLSPAFFRAYYVTDFMNEETLEDMPKNIILSTINTSTPKDLLTDESSIIVPYDKIQLMTGGIEASTFKDPISAVAAINEVSLNF